MLKKVLIVVGSFMALVIIVLGTIFFLFTRQSAIRAQMMPVAITAEAARSFDSKIDAFNKLVDASRAGGQRTPVSLTLTQEEVTSKLDRQLKEAGSKEMPVDARNVQVNLTGGDIKAAADVSVSGLSVSAGIRARVELKNGQPEIAIQEIDTGRMPIPGAVKSKIMDAISGGSSSIKLNLPVDVSSVKIENGSLTLSGTTR